MNKFILHSLTETKDLADKFAHSLLPGMTVGLRGDLGSGKTTFTQLVAQELGVKDMVNSPTFLVLKEHPLFNKQGINKLYHLDFYRLDNKRQVEEVGIKDILLDKEGIVFIEWPEKGADFLPEHTVYLDFKYLDENTREVQISNDK